MSRLNNVYKWFTRKQYVYLLCAKMYTCLRIGVHGVLKGCVRLCFIVYKSLNLCTLDHTFWSIDAPGKLL
jgi:hypothetical protein